MKLRKDRNCSLDFRTCKICNKPLDNLTALATHIFRLHHIKSKDYYDKYLKTNDDGKCICCGKETTYRNFYYHNNSQYDYFPDFKVFNTLVEIKGPHFFDKNGSMINPFDRTQDAKYEAKHQCMIKNNVHIIINCDTYIKYVEDNYSKNFKQLHIYKKDSH